MVTDTMGELRAALYGRNSVFIGSMETPMERIVYRIIYDALCADNTVIWICLKETPGSILARFSFYELPLKQEERLWFIDATITGDNTIMQHTIRCASMDYVCLAAHAGRILNMYPGSLVMLDNVGILAVLERVDITVRFIKYLDSRIRAAGGGLMTVLNYTAVPGSAEAEILGLMDTVIEVGEKEIHAYMGSRKFRIPFDFCGSELILGSGNIETDLKELFNLTPEEKKKLELEVEEKARLYRDFIG